jgi:hypothetical protein
MVSDHRRIDPVMLQEYAGAPGVLGSNPGYIRQGTQSAQRDVIEIANRRRDEIEDARTRTRTIRPP